MLHNPQGIEAFVDAFLLGFPGLFAVVNPIGGAFVFQTMLDGGSPARRATIARRVSIYSCCVRLSALWRKKFAPPNPSPIITAISVAHCFDALYVELWSESDARPRKRKAASKTRYTCPTCGANAWAKQQTSLMCGDCEVAMEADAEA